MRRLLVLPNLSLAQEDVSTAIESIVVGNIISVYEKDDTTHYSIYSVGEPSTTEFDTFNMILDK